MNILLEECIAVRFICNLWG